MKAKLALITFLCMGAFGPHVFGLGLKGDSSEFSLRKPLYHQIDSIRKTLFSEDFDRTLLVLQQLEKQAIDSSLWDVQLYALLNMHYCSQEHGVVDSMVFYLDAVREVYQAKKQAIPVELQNEFKWMVNYANANAAYNFGLYEKAIIEFKKNLIDDSLSPLFRFKCLSFIGQSYSRLNNYYQAIAYHLQALKYLPDSSYFSYHRGLSASYLGGAYKERFNNELDTISLRKSLFYYFQSIDYFSDSFMRNKKGPINGLNLLSELYDMLGFPDSSAFFLKKAEVLDPENPETLRFWGMHHASLGNYGKARNYFERSNEVVRHEKGSNHYLIGRNTMRIGEQYAAEERWEEAIHGYQKAFEYLGAEEGFSENILTHPDLDHMVSPRDFFECLELKAAALRKWSGAGTDPEGLLRLKKSIETYELAVAFIDEQRAKFESHSYKQFIAAKSLSLYENAIAACSEAIHRGLDEVKYTQLAFYLMEKNKNRQLRDALRVSQMSKYAGVPDTLLYRGKKIEKKLRYSNRLLIEQKKSGKPDLAKIQRIENKVFSLTNEWQQFHELLKAEYPAYHQLKYGEPIADLLDLQERLEPGTLLLEYFYGDEEVFLFTVSSEKVEFLKLTPSPRLNKLLPQALRVIKDPAPGQQLTKDLVADLHALKQHLLPFQPHEMTSIDRFIVIPDGPLGYFPFEMLVTRPDELPRFLLEDVALSYAYSSYLVGMEPASQRPDLEYLGFAPSYSASIANRLASEDRGGDGQQLLGTLRYNREEVMDAKTLFSGAVLLDSASTEESFRRQGSAAGILHFSMHALINDKDPELSRLVFYQPDSPTDSSELDGDLYLYELYNESLQAQLAVLSACNTGDGQLKRGEGISSLGRAFRYAGCNSIVMSLWRANDRHTQFLMKQFFTYLEEGMSKDKALRQAKLDFLKEPAHKYFRHPYYWASFIQMGDPSKLILGKTYAPWVVIILGIMGGCLLLGGYYKIRRFTSGQGG